MVDSFFPFLERVEEEVLGIENLIFSETGDQPPPPTTDSTPSIEVQPEKKNASDEKQSVSTPTLTEKTVDHPKPSPSGRKTHFAIPAAPSLLYRRFKRFIRGLASKVPDYRPDFKHTPTPVATNIVHRMTRTRRLVTSLTRLLALKSEVVSQVQKRLLSAGEWGLRNGTDHMDVYMYMGDVQGASLRTSIRANTLPLVFC